MTVNTENIYSGPYTGNDISDTFSYGFRIQDESQLNVYKTDDEGNRELLTLTTDYTVTGVDNDLGGTITLVAGALPLDYEIFIEANYPATQDTAFASQGRFNPKIHEDALDKLTFLIKQLQYALTNTVQFSPGYVGASPVLPDPEAGDLIRWTEDGIEGLTIGELLSEASAIISQLDMNGNQIKDLAAATAGTDAVNLTQVTQLLAQAGVDGVVPTVFPTQTGDGTTTTFSTPASGNTGVIASSFFVHVDTAYQTPDVHFSVDVSTGDLTFVAPPPLDSKIYITYFNPIAIENPDTALITATNTTTPRKLDDRFVDHGVNIKDEGALGDGTDSTSAIQAAKSKGLAYFPDGNYPDSLNGEFYLYPSNMEAEGGFLRYAVGGTTQKTSDPRPVMLLEKTIDTDKGGLGNFDAGGLYVQVNKKGGDALVTGITGYVRSVDGPSDAIGVHGRAALNKANNNDLTGSEGFGGWSYCDINPTGGGLVTEGVGHEVDVRNRGDDIPFSNTPLPVGSTQGTYRGIIVVTADNSLGYCSEAIDVGAQAGSKEWYTGIRLRLNGIAPSGVVGEDTCQMRVQGADVPTNRYGGISFDAGNLTYGLNLAAGASYQGENAIILATGNRILFDNNFRHLSWDGANYNFNQGGISINGVRVLSAQQPAIPNSVGGDESAKINSILSALRVHGLIDT